MIQTQSPGRSAARLLLIPVLLLYGCATPHDASRVGEVPAAEQIDSRGGAASASFKANRSSVSDERAAALLDGRPIRWADLRPAMTEAAGAEALQETILDRQLARNLATAQIVVTEADVEAERARLLATLAEDPDLAVRRLDMLRDRQRLGPQRFEALLRRNAMLRALVRDQVAVTDDAVERMHEALHGPRRQVRLITTRRLAEAEAVVRDVRAGAFFGDIAVERSTDASAARGGLLEPISSADPAYPAALRRAIWSLDDLGDISDPILLDTGYAVVMLVREVPADGVTLDESRDEIEKLVRMNQERLLMDETARRILREAKLTIIVDALNDSWQRARRAGPR
jgi:parvulin-like peptidyl-prolyl isomerase